MKIDFIETSFFIPIIIEKNMFDLSGNLFFNRENINTSQRKFSIHIKPLKKTFKDVILEELNIYHRKKVSFIEIKFNFEKVFKDFDLLPEDILEIVYFLKENYKNQKRYSIFIDGSEYTLVELLYEILKNNNIIFSFYNSNKKIFEPHLYNILYFNLEEAKDEVFDLDTRILLEQFTEGTRQTYKRDYVDQQREFKEFSNILWNINEISCSVGVIKSKTENSEFINKNFHSILNKDYKNFFIYTLFSRYELQYYEKTMSELLIFKESESEEIKKKYKSSRDVILKFYEFRQRYLFKNISQNVQQQRVIEHIKTNFKLHQNVLNVESLINTLEKTTNLLWNELENIRIEAEIVATNKRQRLIEIIAIFIGSYEAFKVIYDIIKDLMINIRNTLFIFLATSLVTTIVVFIVVKTMKKVLNEVDKNKEERK